MELRRKPGHRKYRHQPGFGFRDRRSVLISLTWCCLPAVQLPASWPAADAGWSSCSSSCSPGYRSGKGGTCATRPCNAEVEKRIRDCFGDLGLSVKQHIDLVHRVGGDAITNSLSAQQGAEARGSGPRRCDEAAAARLAVKAWSPSALLRADIKALPASAKQ